MNDYEPRPLESGLQDKLAIRPGRAYPIFVLLFTMPIVAAAQVLYTNGFLNGSSTVQVDSINLSTGSLTPVVTTDAISLAGAQAAFDPVGHRLFFVGTPANATVGLYTANVQTGAFSRLPGSFGNLEFDASTGTLYTLNFLNGSSTVQVARINLSTGALTPVVTTDAVSLLSSDAAFDPVGHRLFFVGTAANAPPGLYTANVQTGAFSKLPGSFGNLVFDVATSTLYTDGFINGSSTVQVASINLSSGALTPVVTTDAVSLLSVDAAFDPVGHRLFFVGTPANAPLGLYAANVQTGAFSRLSGSFGNLIFDSGGPVNPPVTPAPSTLMLVVIGLSGVIVARAWNYTRRAKKRSGAYVSTA